MFEGYNRIPTITMDHEVFEGKSGQEIKDMLFALIGRPDRIGEKNTPPRFGKNMDEIKGSILRIMKAQAQTFGKDLPAYGVNVEDNQEGGDMPRKKNDTNVETEETPLVPKKRNYKKKEESTPAYLPLTPFHFPTGHIQFLVNMDVLSCNSVETMVIHTSHKKQYAYNPVTELYYLLAKDGKLGDGVEII